MSSSTTTTSALRLPPPRKAAPPAQQQQQQQRGGGGGGGIGGGGGANHGKQQLHQAKSGSPLLLLLPGGGGGGGAVAQHPPCPSYEERCRAAGEAARARNNKNSNNNNNNNEEQEQQNHHQRPNVKLFVPRQLADFGDGGAFPEIHVAQYPRHMGNPHLLKRNQQQQQSGGNSKSNSSNTSQMVVVAAVATSKAIVNVEVDETGDISYDAIVKGGTNSDKLVYTKLEDMRGGAAVPADVALATPEEEALEAARTHAALQALLTQKTALDKASGSAMVNAATSQNVDAQTEFIKYTARPDAPGYNPAAATRIVQMVPAQLDPLMPPKHRHVKAPRGPAEDPVPVLHAPPQKLTQAEQEAWKVPACISNWKNTRGYAIPLDKRLAADGRGLLQQELNSTNFAALSESLYVAERQARQEVRLRAVTQQKLVLAESEEREAALRRLAQQARFERGGGVGGGGGRMETIDGVPRDEEDASDDDSLSERAAGGKTRRTGSAANVVPHEDSEDDVAARQREKLRLERKRERERELRSEQNVELKKKQRLEEERDVSEKIALGVMHSTGTGGGQDNVDSRLYNQTAGMDSGFGADDEYNAYSKPLFEAAAAAAGSAMYRPTRGETEYNADEQYDKLKEGATSKFQPHKGFGGAEGGVSGAGPRTAPVQFEKAKPK